MRAVPLQGRKLLTAMEYHSIYGPWPESPEHDELTVSSLDLDLQHGTSPEESSSENSAV